jgi:patatin-like phospholipase/acyl hydrolase
MSFRILCIDGGGIRGIIPAVILADIERRTGRRISELFDLIAGTSTGGILALALVKPDQERKPEYTAEDVIRLYETQGENIFSRSLLHRIVSLDGLANKKYQSGPVEKVFEKFFGNVLLSEALTPVMITSYDIQSRDAFFFRSYRAAKRTKKKFEYDYLMWNVARATSAAPTYFEPELIEKGDDAYALIDGGVFANNPSMCALVDAMREFKKGLEHVFMVSLGTGSEKKQPFEFQRVKNWGVVNWAQPLLTIVFNGITDTVNYQTDLILNAANSPQQFYRFQIDDLPRSLYSLDNVAATNISLLKESAEQFLKTDKGEKQITEVCEALIKKEPLAKKKPIARARRARSKPMAA